MKEVLYACTTRNKFFASLRVSIEFYNDGTYLVKESNYAGQWKVVDDELYFLSKGENEWIIWPASEITEECLAEIITNVAVERLIEQ